MEGKDKWGRQKGKEREGGLERKEGGRKKGGENEGKFRSHSSFQKSVAMGPAGASRWRKTTLPILSTLVTDIDACFVDRW